MKVITTQRLHSLGDSRGDYLHYIKTRVAIIVMVYIPGCREQINFNLFYLVLILLCALKLEYRKNY